MVNIQNVTEDILWIGASDRRLARFENLFPLTRGVSYNNYVVLDEKITVFDTSDVSVADQYLENLQGALGDRQPDYLVVLHMEPDHCSQLANVLRLYPDVTVVGSAQTFNFMKQFFPELADVKRQVVKEGDVLLGLPSSGVHSNGYSLVRKICFEHKGFKGDEYIDELGKTIGEELLTPTRLYPKTCLPLIEKFDIHGMVHITGGGFYDNIPRALPEGMAVEIDSSVWQMPTIFRLLQQWGNVDWHEMYRTFNMGIGMVIMASREEADKIKAHLEAEHETVYEIGRVVRGNHDVTIKGGVFDE